MRCLLSMALAILVTCTSTVQAFPLVLWVDGDTAAKPKPIGLPSLPSTDESVKWDASGLAALQAASSAAESPAGKPDLYVAQITKPFCAPCVQQWETGKRELMPRGYTFGGKGHFRQEINPTLPTPQYELRRGNEVLQRWPSGTSWAMMANAFRKAFDEPAATVTDSQPYGFVSLGEIPAKAEITQFIETMRPILGDSGKLVVQYYRNGQLAPLTLPFASNLSIIIPASSNVTWTMKGESVVISADKPLVLQISGSWPVSLRIDGLTIGKEKIIPSVQGMIDPYIKVR